MSELFDEDANDGGDGGATKTAPRRSRALLITAVVLVLLIFGLTGFASIYTDRLWYQSAGYGSVFSTLLWTRIGLFAVFGLVMGGAVALNIYLAYRFRPLFAPTTRDQSNLARYRDVLTPIRLWVVIGTGVIVGAFAGTSGMGHWRTFMLWRNAQDFGTTDEHFGKDIGFYVFHLPWWHFVVDFAMATCVIALIAAVAVHYLYGGIRLQEPNDRFSGPAQVQISVLLGLFVLVKGIDYYLDRFDLVTEQNSLFTGMNFTADNAVLPAKNILLGVAAICAVLFFANVWRRTWQLPAMGLALMVLSAILLGMIWPAIVQQFQVKPSEADKEAPYIQANIDATREAYDLGDIDEAAYEPDNNVASNDLATVLSGTSSVPLVDPKIVQPAFQNIQQGRAFYDVAPVLDVDRYEIDGTDRALVLGVRELNQDRINDDDRNWSNLHTVYTHGNGIIAAYANQRNEDDQQQVDTEDAEDANGGLEWAQGKNTGEDDLQQATGGFENRVYYGEQSPDYSVVGAADGENGVELNLPTPGSEEGTTTTYDGPGDADVGGAFNQLMFAVKFGEPNFLLSGRVNENSKVLFDRNPQDRVEKVAPWLTVDSDAYPAVVDNRIVWILDGYTTTDRYPGSQRESFDTMTDDALQVDTGIATVPTDEINYMRNAVKATVDAYSGEVTLYEWDEADPMLKAWMGAFPGTVKPKADMSTELLQHVRYPEDQFKVQRYQFARYHVTDADDWYQGNDRWDVPQDPYATNTFQPPYRLFVDNPETPEDDPSFSLTSVYVPYGRGNLASFLSVSGNAAADQDGEPTDYGRMQVLELSGNEQIFGPGQVANQFGSDPDVADALAEFNRSNATPLYGNVLTFPINEGLMYVQPIYAQRQSTESNYPVLRYVLVKYGDDVAFGTTFRGALQQLFGSGSTTPPDTTGPGEGDGEGNNGDGQGQGNQTLQESLDAALQDALDTLDEAQAARESGDLGKYQRKVDQAQTLLNEVARLKMQIDGTSTDSSEGNGQGDDPGDGSGDAPSQTPSTEPGSTPSNGG